MRLGLTVVLLRLFWILAINTFDHPQKNTACNGIDSKCVYLKKKHFSSMYTLEGQFTNAPLPVLW
jgi:hypothetical protein